MNTLNSLLSLDQFATLRAKLDAGADSAALYAESALSEPEWMDAQEVWLSALSDDADRGEVSQLVAYSAAYRRAWAEVTGIPMDAAPLVADPVSEAAKGETRDDIDTPLVAAVRLGPNAVPPTSQELASRPSPWAVPVHVASAPLDEGEATQLPSSSAARGETLPFAPGPGCLPPNSQVLARLASLDAGATLPISLAKLGRVALPFAERSPEPRPAAALPFPSEAPGDVTLVPAMKASLPKATLPFQSATGASGVRTPLPQSTAPVRRADDEEGATQVVRGNVDKYQTLPFTGASQAIVGSGATAQDQDDDEVTVVQALGATTSSGLKSEDRSIPSSTSLPLTIEQYGALRAEMDVDPSRSVQWMAQYGLTQEMCAVVDAAFRRAIGSDRATAQKFDRAYAAARAQALAGRKSR